MIDEVSHLTASAAALLAETDERRIRAIRSEKVCGVMLMKGATTTLTKREVEL